MDNSHKLFVLLRHLFHVVLGILLTTSFVSLLIIIPELMRNCVCLSFEGLKNFSTFFEPVSNLYTLTATLLAIYLALRQLDLAQNNMEETSKQLKLSSRQLKLTTKQLNTSIALSPSNLRANSLYNLLENSIEINTHFNEVFSILFDTKVLPYLSNRIVVRDINDLEKYLKEIFEDIAQFLEEGDLLYMECGASYPSKEY